MLKEWCSGPAPPPPSLFETQYRALSEFKIEGCSAKSKERERERKGRVQTKGLSCKMQSGFHA